ncbi:MAG: hypothetical protein JSR82_20225 [Verrucomicrobia bacterium]|nr:hypothetical protein [Verrucomicrobiota bacterium]
MPPPVDLPVNPFAHHIVAGPRERPPSVDSLNRDVFERVLAAFEPLAQALPGDRDQVAAPATLVLSSAPGYGKSHLITRLFAALAGRATLVWVQPFQAPSLCWHSLLLQAVNELRQPEATNEAVTQLDLLAQRVLRAVTASALAHGELERPENWEAIGDALIAHDWWDLRRPWRQVEEWLLDVAYHDHRILTAELDRQPGQARLRSTAWLRVLTTWLTHAPGTAAASACLAWMRGEALEDDEREALGLSVIDTMQPESEEALNSLAHHRIHDLCALARFHRPWFFCFDQTEDYGTSPRLAAMFGFVVARLVNEHRNQMTVVTANKDVWDRRVWPEVDAAHHDRFGRGLLLEGLQREQAGELISLRLAPWSVEPAVAEKFADPRWLEKLFPSQRATLGPREFLKLCQVRWADGAELPPPPSLEEVFAEFRARMEASPKQLAFAPDPFRWLLRGPLAPTADACVDADDVEGLVELRWPKAARGPIDFTFGFGWSHVKWGRLARRVLPPASGPRRPAKIVVFRTPELDDVPRATWQINGPKVRAAQHHGLHLLQLTPTETAELYAARQMFLESEAGNIDGHDSAAVLEFLRVRLTPWRERILGPVEARPSGPPGAQASLHAGRLEELLRAEKFLSASDAAQRLGAPWDPAAVVHAAGELTSLEVIASPAMTVLLWRG